MMKNKKVFAILTLVCFLFTLMPVAAMASDTPSIIEVSSAEEFREATTQSGITIKFKKDITGPGVFIEKNQKLTIDLGGNTYTVIDPTVGSEGTKTQGFHFEGDVTLKNGKIVIDENATVKMLVQNYGDLNLTDIILDGTNGTEPSTQPFYTLSNNSGDININGETSIIAPDGKNFTSVAFDVCRYANYTEPTVTVDTTGTIVGKIEVTTTSKDKLKIKAGAFTDLPNAVRHAVDGATIILAEDVTNGSGIVIDNDVIIDLNNKIYNISGPAVGSTGTVTLGFQILKDNNVIIKDGKITESTVESAGTGNVVKRLIQNYANLTLENVVLDGTTLNNGQNIDRMVMSNNNGAVVITGNTKILGLNTGTAFDVYDYSDGGYTGVTVTFDDNFVGEVVGAMVVDGDEKENVNAKLIIKAGTFSSDPSEYLVDGKCVKQSATSFIVGTHSLSEATCINPKTCSHCGKTEGTVGGHALTAVPKVAATYSATGMQAHDKCSTCGKLFVNGEEKTKEELTIPKKVSYSGGGSYTSSTSNKTETSTTTTPNGTTIETTTETTKDGTTVETTTTTTASGETSTTVTATLENGSSVTNNDEDVEVEVTDVEKDVVEAAEEAAEADENVDVVGTADNAVKVSATNASTGAEQATFEQPMSVSVPVDNKVLKNVEDTSKLTLAKVVTNADGTTSLEYMGGSYDAKTGTFTAKVDEEGDYILVEKADLVKIELNIGNKDVKHNDKNEKLDVAPQINAKEGRTELPLRYLGEALGFAIDWNDNVVTITKDGVSFSLTIGKEIPGFGTPYIEGDRTMVSARYISEKLGANVIWDPMERQVIVVK